MPKIFRVMKEEAGKPRLGSGGSTLGVRLPGGAGGTDITPDADGNVRPGRKGMSVAPDLEALLRHLPNQVPRRLRFLESDPDVPEDLRRLAGRARGENSLHVWSMGEGPFESGPLTEDLELLPDPVPAYHGVVIPVRKMPAVDYQKALWGTQALWSKDEQLKVESQN
jgi:hypothetical protein